MVWFFLLFLHFHSPQKDMAVLPPKEVDPAREAAMAAEHRSQEEELAVAVRHTSLETAVEVVDSDSASKTAVTDNSGKWLPNGSWWFSSLYWLTSPQGRLHAQIYSHNQSGPWPLACGCHDWIHNPECSAIDPRDEDRYAEMKRRELTRQLSRGMKIGRWSNE